MKNSWPQCGRPAGYSETSWTRYCVPPTSVNRYNFRTTGWQTCTPEQIFSFAEKIHKISLFSWQSKCYTFCDVKQSKIHLQIYWNSVVNKTKQTVRGLSKFVKHKSSFTNQKDEKMKWNQMSTLRGHSNSAITQNRICSIALSSCMLAICISQILSPNEKYIESETHNHSAGKGRWAGDLNCSRFTKPKKAVKKARINVTA